MDASDEGDRVSVSSIPNSMNSEQKDVLSEEDIAWVDSCLNDSAFSENNWTSMRDALLDFFSSYPELPDSSAVASCEHNEGTDVEILPSLEEDKTTDLNPSAVTSHYDSGDNALDSFISGPRTEDDTLFYGVAAETSADNDELPPTFRGNPFLPTYDENLRGNEEIDSELNSNLSISETGLLAEDIFKVWDLEIPSEEDDELVQMLNKALADRSFQHTPSGVDSLGDLKDLKKEESLDDLIAGISDLSLNQNSS